MGENYFMDEFFHANEEKVCETLSLSPFEMGRNVRA
jgi:hypothetical protein